MFLIDPNPGWTLYDCSKFLVRTQEKCIQGFLFSAAQVWNLLIENQSNLSLR